MSENKTETEDVVRYLEENLQKMPKNLRLFSMSMRSLYSENNPGISTDVSRKFAKLRDDTREDAKVYLKVILPSTSKLVSAIKDLFEYYDALSYEEWCASLPDILKDIKDNKDFSETLLKMYEEITGFLSKREDEARIVITQFREKQTECENAANEFQVKAKTKQKWALVLLFIPGVNLIVSPLLLFHAKRAMAKAAASMQDSKIHNDAAIIVAENLIPALANFVNGLTNAANFFKTVETKINSLEGRGKEIKLAHYKIMKNKVRKINALCHEFHAALPAIRTDFEAIPDGDAQQNYVQTWLEEKLKDIEKKRRESTRKHFGGLRATMASSSVEPAEISYDEQA